MICDIVIFKDQFLGEGAFGSVFMGKLHRKFCAVKVLRPLVHEIKAVLLSVSRTIQLEALERFKRECDFLEKIDHANVVHHIASRIHPESNTPVLALELLDCSLTQYLKQSTTDLPMKTQISLCCDVASALAYLHESPRNIVHRDLCSDNILLRLADPIPVAKVADFGMSRIIDCTSHRHSLTAMGHREGYMPPEASSSNYDSSLDIFMFGVVMIQIAQNIHYIGSERERFELWKRMPRKHPLNEDITSCLHKDKEKRIKAVTVHHSLRLILEDFTFPQHDVSYREDNLPLSIFGDSDSLCEYLDNYSDLSISNSLDSSSVSVPINIRPDVLLQALQAQDSSPIAEITNLPIQPQSNRPQTLPPAALHTNDSVETVDYPSVDQLSKLSKTLKQRFKKIGVIYFSIADSSIATNIVELFNVLLSGGLCIVQAMDMTKDSSQWFHKVCDAGVDYYLFIGLPPLGKLKGFTPSPEEKFFDPTRDGQRVGEVVVVTTKNTPLSPGGRAMDDHYLSKFLHLDSITPETTANRALALFAGMLSDGLVLFLTVKEFPPHIS